MEQNLITLKRQRELIRINRVLAVLVAVLAFAGGFLLAEREEWLKKQTELTTTNVVPLSTVTTYPVSGFAASPLTTLLSGARYDWTIGNAPLTQASLSKLVWAAQGKITSWGERTVPSYKSTFPLTLVVLVRQVSGMNPGLYVFDAVKQSLQPHPGAGELSYPETQPGLIKAPVIMGLVAPAALKNDPLTWNEAGGIAQNVLLAANEEALNTYLVPAVTLPATLTAQLAVPDTSLYWLMPVGKRPEH